MADPDELAERITHLEADMPLGDVLKMLIERSTSEKAAELRSAINDVVAPCTRCGHSTFEHDICEEELDANGNFVPKRDCQACDCPWYEGADDLPIHNTETETENA